jgi:hypothetical protein
VHVSSNSAAIDVQPQFNVECPDIYECEASVSFEPNHFAMETVATIPAVESTPIVETAVSIAPKKQKSIKPKAKSKNQPITTEAEKYLESDYIAAFSFNRSDSMNIPGSRLKFKVHSQFSWRTRLTWTNLQRLFLSTRKLFLAA